MITFSNVSKQYGGQILFLEASFHLGDGEKVGLVGPNGAGKSTVFRLITGEEHPDDGVVDRPKRTTIRKIPASTTRSNASATSRRASRSSAVTSSKLALTPSSPGWAFRPSRLR